MEIYLNVYKLADEIDTTGDLKRRLDELLDVYSLYLKTGIESVKEEVIAKAFELHLRNPQFTFVV